MIPLEPQRSYMFPSHELWTEIPTLTPQNSVVVDPMRRTHLTLIVANRRAPTVEGEGTSDDTQGIPWMSNLEGGVSSTQSLNLQHREQHQRLIYSALMAFFKRQSPHLML